MWSYAKQCENMLVLIHIYVLNWDVSNVINMLVIDIAYYNK